MKRDSKWQNFDVSPEQEAELARLRETLDAPSMKDAILRAARIVSTLANEVREGRALYVGSEDGGVTRVLIPDLQPSSASKWKYLAARAASVAASALRQRSQAASQPGVQQHARQRSEPSRGRAGLGSAGSRN